ncbi:hypothetical protein MNV49_000489 [Pseudohyphozyma bogoriensis]|nr:hypothetical protein MNV49_000489 [Pseudohyphozyma bogoriensis]
MSSKNAIKIAIIGSGISGINQAIRLKQDLGNRAVITFASQPEVLAYWEGLLDKHGLRPSVKVNSEYVSSTWLEDEQAHAIVFKDTASDPKDGGNTFTVTANILISATGPLAKHLLPDIPGLRDFGGDWFHNLEWDNSLVPGVAAIPGVHLTHIIRSGGYYLPKVNYAYSERLKWAFAHVPGLLRLYRFKLAYEAWSKQRLLKDSKKREAAGEKLLEYARATAPAKYLEALTPHYPYNCKRVARNAGWLESLHRENVELVLGNVVNITKEGLQTEDGRFFPADVIIYATGSDVAQYGLGLRDGLKGLDGQDLGEFYDSLGGPEAYLGLAVPYSRAISTIIKELVDLGLSSIEPKYSAFERHNTKLKRELAGSVAKSPLCHNYGRIDGKLTVNSSYTSIGLWWATRKPHWKDWKGTRRTNGGRDLQTVNVHHLAIRHALSFELFCSPARTALTTSTNVRPLTIPPTFVAQFIHKMKSYPYWLRRQITGQRIVFNILFYGGHAGLFAYGWHKQQSDPRLATLNTLEFSVWISRGSGLALAVDGLLLVLPAVLRNVICLLRPRLIWLLPLEENLWFHRQVAYSILFFTIVHTTMHYVNMFHVESTQVRKESAAMIMYTQSGAFTGHVMLVIMFLMYTTAHAKIRKQCFEAFWYTHHLIRARRTTIITSVLMHPSGAYEIRFEKPSLKYRPGMWLFVNVPEISKFQWHPFTISSAPDDPYISIHVRRVGDFTRALGNRLGSTNGSAAASSTDVSMFPSKWLSSSLAYIDVQETLGAWYAPFPTLRIDGPYGAPAEDVFIFEVAVLIGTGIGVTPYVSVLKNIWYMQQKNQAGALKRVEFIWCCRDVGDFKWFETLLHQLEDMQTDPDFLRIRLYFTGKMQTEAALK